jgi:hypothetical protein
MSIIYIWIIIILLIFAAYISIYTLQDIHHNIDSYITVYINLKK